MLAAMLALVLGQEGPRDARLTDLNDGFVRVESATYSVEVPKGWTVSLETRWGQRKIKPEDAGGELGVMTAPPSQQSWDEIYEVSLYFILRDSSGEATPYEVVKLKNGLEAARFAVKDSDGFESRRFLLIKHPEHGLLALSVRIPGREAEEAWLKNFQRMADSAKFKPSRT